MEGTKKKKIVIAISILIFSIALIGIIIFVVSKPKIELNKGCGKYE